MAECAQTLELSKDARALLDSLAEEIIVCDITGHIVFANSQWRNFATENGDPDGKMTCVGSNYKETCERAMQSEDSETASTAFSAWNGIEEVITGQRKFFDLEYFCDHPVDPRWFLLHATPFSGHPELAVIAHYNINQRKLAETSVQAWKQQCEEQLWCFLPRTVADELKESKGAIATSHKCATIVFCDIVDFTPLASTLQPMELVTLLSDLFVVFDDLVESHGLETIKTIGDAYMAAAGLPIECADHAQRAANYALDAVQSVAQFNRDHGTSLRLRMGFHSGPVVSGVTGSRKFAFDVWGDAVNVASRMESTGQPGKINVSESSYDILKDDYLFEPRGDVTVKGKGVIKCFFLLGKKNPTSSNAGQYEFADDS